jgi:hypothetical protein
MELFAKQSEGKLPTRLILTSKIDQTRLAKKTQLPGDQINMQLLGKIMGDPNKRDLKAIQPFVDKINAFEPAIKALSDEELAAKTAEFREQLYLHLKGGTVLEDELVRLFRETLKTVDTPGARKAA